MKNSILDYEESIQMGVNHIISRTADDVLELDELWNYFHKRDNKLWNWIALCRRTRQVVAYVCGKHTGLTNHVERFNATARHRLGRLTRKTLSLSKTNENHEAVLHAFIVQYNHEIRQKYETRPIWMLLDYP